MDTLASRGDDKKPSNYTSKIYLLPHLRGIMCGTGAVDVIKDWYNFIQYNVIAKDSNFLNKITQPFLKDIWKSYEWQPDSSATIYHFGYDSEKKQFSGYAFRSQNNFKPEKLENRMAIKPPDIVPNELLSDLDPQMNFFDVIIEIFKRLIKANQEKELSERVCIGGEIQLAIFEEPDIQHLLTLYRFEDFDDNFCKMLEFAKNNWEKYMFDYLKNAIKNLFN